MSFLLMLLCRAFLLPIPVTWQLTKSYLFYLAVLRYSSDSVMTCPIDTGTGGRHLKHSATTHPMYGSRSWSEKFGRRSRGTTRSISAWAFVWTSGCRTMARMNVDSADIDWWNIQKIASRCENSIILAVSDPAVIRDIKGKTEVIQSSGKDRPP